MFGAPASATPARESSVSRLGPPLRVRTRRDYYIPFDVNFGQRNAVFLERPWAPLKRVVYWGDAVTFLPEPDYDIVHAVNAVPVFSRRPYVMTFSDFMPRVPEDRYVGWLERWLQRELLSPRCVALLALSEYAARQFREQNRDFPGLARLEEKLEVRYPAVAPRRSEPKPAPTDELKLLFVGRDFMRKGGPALVRAHEQLRAAGVPVRTTIVSSLGWKANDTYVDPPSPELVAREHARIEQEGIVHIRSAPNAEVYRLMEETHYFIFPTLHDIFGYVMLEALACATPVIATATNATPEVIEEGRSGHLLPLELDGRLGRWAWTYRTSEPGFVPAYEAATDSLADALAERLAKCWEARDGYPALSAGALERARTRFSSEIARERLEELYERCRERLPPSRRLLHKLRRSS
jgi:glycosyltransferase involved in cell wall biosynthesis